MGSQDLVDQLVCLSPDTPCLTSHSTLHCKVYTVQPTQLSLAISLQWVVSYKCISISIIALPQLEDPLLICYWCSLLLLSNALPRQNWWELRWLDWNAEMIKWSQAELPFLNVLRAENDGDTHLILRSTSISTCGHGLWNLKSPFVTKYALFHIFWT